MPYDDTNIFAKILRNDIPSTRLYEDSHTLAFYDISPNAPVHVLVIPKGPYTHYSDFIANASEPEITGFFRAVHHVAQQLGVADAFRLITNNGEKVGQSVPHFHVHLLAGKPMHALLPTDPTHP